MTDGPYRDEQRFGEIERRRRVTQDSIDTRTEPKGSKWRHPHGSVDVADQLRRYKWVVERLVVALHKNVGTMMPVNVVLGHIRALMAQEGLKLP